MTGLNPVSTSSRWPRLSLHGLASGLLTVPRLQVRVAIPKNDLGTLTSLRRQVASRLNIPILPAPREGSVVVPTRPDSIRHRTWTWSRPGHKRRVTVGYSASLSDRGDSRLRWSGHLCGTRRHRPEPRMLEFESHPGHCRKPSVRGKPQSVQAPLSQEAAWSSAWKMSSTKVTLMLRGSPSTTLTVRLEYRSTVSAVSTPSRPSMCALL
jgi:hypothetical protein